MKSRPGGPRSIKPVLFLSFRVEQGIPTVEGERKLRSQPNELRAGMKTRKSGLNLDVRLIVAAGYNPLRFRGGGGKNPGVA